MDDKELLAALDSAARAREAKGHTPTTYLHAAAARLRELVVENARLEKQYRERRDVPMENVAKTTPEPTP